MLLSLVLHALIAILPLAATPRAPAAPTPYAVLAAEYKRGGDVAMIHAAAASSDTTLQRLAARAYGRLEQREHADRVRALLTSPAPAVRREAANAMAQMGAEFDYAELLARERDGGVRGGIYEAIGRTPVVPGEDTSASADAAAAVVSTLTRGLREGDPRARIGAARGLESLLRRTARSNRPAEATVGALRTALRAALIARDGRGEGSAEQQVELRQLLLLGLTAAGDRDPATMSFALRDSSAQVRRLAVALSRQWVDDGAPMVRYQALRVAGTCERATAALRDPSSHVQLTAVDALGERRCDAALLDSLVTGGGNWRIQAHALVSLARVDTSRARSRLSVLATSPIWQARAWAGTAAMIVKDSATLALLARDSAPNVAASALATTDDALRALGSDHAGLVFAAANRLKGDAQLAALAPKLADAVLRLSRRREATLRDPRVALLQRLLVAADGPTARRLQPLLRDVDPAVAALAARVITERAQVATKPATTRYAPPSFPSERTLDGLRGARAVITLRGLGEIEIDLLPEDAPATVALFADLAERHRFDGLTWHRIVPNFVLQGGSPGADEYDGLTTTFMRDELGYARHARGTFGISTRGRDTGDGQLFINLVDNFRLDHDYTVFAVTRRGLDVIDRVQEGDVIESVRIVRAASVRDGASRLPQSLSPQSASPQSTSPQSTSPQSSSPTPVAAPSTLISTVLATTLTALAAPTVMAGTVADTGAMIGARSPAYAKDGRLVLSRDGHLLLQRGSGAPFTMLTSGAGWDRDPAWTPDGAAVVFASDRGGNYDLWRVTVNADGTAGVPEQITRTTEPETSPGVAAGNQIVFLRGGGSAARVWVRDASGAERRLTGSSDTELSPAVTHNGAEVAFLTATESGRRLHVWPIAANAPASQRTSQTVDASTDQVSWAWDGKRLAISTRTGVYIVPRSGGYTNFASASRGHTAWSPDDRTIALAAFVEPNVAYNGDPDRGSDRSAVLRPAVSSDERLLLVAAPIAPDVSTVLPQSLASQAAADREAHNAAAFDRVWERSTRLYFSDNDAAPRRAEWERVRNSMRPRAIAAATDSALDMVLHATLQQRPTLRAPASGRAAVSSAHPVATEAGLAILRQGGNVVDAAVAVSFALGVVEPDASGVAGYGEMVIALKSLPKPTLIEFMTRVPEDAGLSNTSLLVNGRYPSDGPVLVNVPGTVSGMYTAWEKYGSKRLPWSALLAPAIKAATDGYIVSDGLATTLATEREHFAKYEGSRKLFFRNGEPMKAGDTLRNPDLAWVLGQIAQRGADGFYKGEVAAKWVADLHGKGNAMKLTDLERYFAPEREPVSGTYRDYTIYSGAPPVSGGAELVARLNLLEQYPAPRSYRDDPATMQATLSSWFLVPSSRGRIADPSLWPINVAPIIDKDTARNRWRCYSPDKALTPASVRGDTLNCLRGNTTPVRGVERQRRDADGPSHENPLHQDAPCGEEHAAEMTVCHSSGTTAFTVADNDGNMVAVTQTLGTWGGNFYVTPGLGFLSNDKLTSYGTNPTQYGSRLPFARNGSTLAPTIAFKGGKPFAAVSAAGNAWITSAVFQTLLGMVDYDLGAQEALELPRFLPGGGFGGGGAAAPYTLQLEDGYSPTVIAALRALGYNLTFVSLRGELREGYGAAVRVDGKVVTAGADPRRAGAAGAIKP